MINAVVHILVVGWVLPAIFNILVMLPLACRQPGDAYHIEHDDTFSVVILAAPIMLVVATIALSAFAVYISYKRMLNILNVSLKSNPATAFIGFFTHLQANLVKMVYKVAGR